MECRSCAFTAHERFFVVEVRGWTRARFGLDPPADRTAVCGFSASGELALVLGLRHPDVYGSIFSASPGGGYRPPEVLPDALPRTYLLAGTEGPFFHANAARWATALAAAGGEVVRVERVCRPPAHEAKSSAMPIPHANNEVSYGVRY